MNNPAITVVGLSKTFGAVSALEDVSLDVAYGEVFAYLGRNGSGKTTTVRILTGLSDPTHGTGSVGGKPLGRVDRAAIGVTMQAAALDPAMTGREHLEFVAAFWGLRRKERVSEVDNSLARFGLTDSADRLIRTYSGGMKRRLDLASALLHRPKLLFLDEPTTGLDAQSRRAMWDEVRALRDRGSAVFLTTQYLEEADELADRVAILDSGRIAVEGTPHELRERIGGVELTLTLAGGAVEETAIALADGRIARAGAGGVIRIPVGDTDEALDALEYVRSMWLIRSARIEAPTLEDVFLQVTGRADSETPVVFDSVA